MAHKSPCWITTNRLFVLLMVMADYAFGPVGSISYTKGSEGSGGKTEFARAGASDGGWQAGS